jgi:hypothetical protein
MKPELSDFILASDIPNIELDISKFNGFHIKTYGWSGLDNFT